MDLPRRWLLKTSGRLNRQCTGGSSIRSWVKNAKQSGGYYDEAIRRAKEAMKYGTLKAIIWHQGEADCHHPEAYKEKIIQLMTDLRNDLECLIYQLS